MLKTNLAYEIPSSNPRCEKSIARYAPNGWLRSYEEIQDKSFIPSLSDLRQVVKKSD